MAATFPAAQERWERTRIRAADSAVSHGAFLCVSDRTGPAATSGPLAGIPFAVKDNINTSELPTTGGTPALDGCRPRRDAPVVATLRAAGAELVGKTNLHELALGITSNNGAFGPVRNPVDPSRSAGGSSGGSAAAVALGVVPFAIGTDTGGSMRIPAAHCGVVGMRPSQGRYSSAGILPLSRTRDTPGVLATTVADVAWVDAVLTGADPLAAAANPVRLDGARIGVPRQGFFDDVDPEVLAAVDTALQQMAAAGAVLIDIPFATILDMDQRCGFPIVFHELARDLPAYLTDLPRPYQTTTLETIATQVRSPDVAGALAAVLANPVSDDGYRKAMAVRTLMQLEYQRVFTRYELTALAYPTVPMLPPPLGEDLTTSVDGREVPVFTTGIRNTSPSTIVGSPAISVPCGRSRLGLPVGLSLEGLPQTDRSLLSVAADVESVLNPDLVNPEGLPGWS